MKAMLSGTAFKRFLSGVLVLFACTVALRSPSAAQQDAPPQSFKAFPAPDIILRDAKHKETKSGVQLQGGQLTITPGVGTPTTINALSFSADGNILAAGKDFGRVVIWNTTEKKFLRALETGQGIVDAVAVSPDGKMVATGGRGGEFSVKIWDVATGQVLKELGNGNSSITALVYEATGRSLIVRYNAGLLRVFTVATWEPALTIENLRAASLSQDGKTLLTADDQEISTWDCSTWSKIHNGPIWKDFPLVLAASTNDDKLAVFQRRTLRIVRGSTAEVILERADFFPRNFTWRPEFAQFNLDGSVLFASVDGRLWVWNLKRDQTCASPEMYSSAGVLSSNGRWFAGSKGDSILATERTDGVWIWETDHIMSFCSN